MAQVRDAVEQTKQTMQSELSSFRPEQVRRIQGMRDNMQAHRAAMLAMTPVELDAQCMLTDEFHPLVGGPEPAERRQAKPVWRIDPDLVDISRPTDVQLISIDITPYTEKYDEEIGYYRHYWIIWQVMKDEATWQKIIDLVKK